jgi:hypothetical protein
LPGIAATMQLSVQSSAGSFTHFIIEKIKGCPLGDFFSFKENFYLKIAYVI